MKKVILGLSVAALSAFAANNYEVGLGLGTHNVSNSPLDDYRFLNVRVGKYLPKGHVLRLELEKSEDIVDDKSLTRALLNVEKDFKTDAKCTPYAFVGIGYQDVEGSYDDNMVADLGLGAKAKINEKFNAFLELRGLRDFGNNDNHFGAIIGINYLFGTQEETKETKEPAPVKVAPKDSDNDGVIDANDKCANTPAGVKVDANGCAIDSDNDGVADYLDKCANTPANVKVDANGCAVDSDNDGVADYLDKCANTPAGVKVDENGCSLTYNFAITFPNNSNKIEDKYMAKIEEFAKFLKENPSYKAEIQGYTDNKGSASYNQKLSEKRAKAVYEALIKLGVSADRLSYKGYGEANPIASNDTAEGRAANRRVVAKLSH